MSYGGTMMKVDVKRKVDFYEIFVNGKYIGLTYNPKNVDEMVKIYLEDPEAVKKCSNCGKTRHKIMFYKSSKSSDGLQAWCKICNHNW